MDFVEAIAEELKLKQPFSCEAAVSTKTILASNTSSFYVKIAEGLRHLHAYTHWFNPPHVIPVVEVIPAQTSPDTINRTISFQRTW